MPRLKHSAYKCLEKRKLSDEEKEMFEHVRSERKRQCSIRIIPIIFLSVCTGFIYYFAKTEDSRILIIAILFGMVDFIIIMDFVKTFLTYKKSMHEKELYCAFGILKSCSLAKRISTEHEKINGNSLIATNYIVDIQNEEMNAFPDSFIKTIPEEGESIFVYLHKGKLYGIPEELIGKLS